MSGKSKAPCCGHAADEHSVYGCVDGCACEKRPDLLPKPLANAPQDYNHEFRVKALAMSEMDLRRAVDKLLEQCGREEAYPAPSSPRNGMLHVTEIYMVLGLQRPDPSALKQALEQGEDGEK